MNERETQRLALEGGMRAVAQIEGKGQPKIGVEEFMSVAERFGFTGGTLVKIREAVLSEDVGTGPFLANYYAPLDETKVQAVERTARELFAVPYAIGVSSGTAALHAAFVAAGVGPGTEVICPAIGFFATAAAVVMAKGIPVFCDVDLSLGIDPAKLEVLITPRTVALAPTHVMGSVCDMAPILEVARKHGLKVVEDCAQSCGATYRDTPVGALGDLGCFSISAYKTVGGGEGGLVLTHDERLWERASGLVECGGLWRPDRFAPPRYKGELFCGTNYRMSELEAAVDVIQLGKMKETTDRFRTVKHHILERLYRFREVQPQKLNDPDGEVGYTLRFYPETIELGERIVAALEAEGVSSRIRGQNGRPDWHVYHSMFAVVNQTGATSEGCPFTCPIYTDRGGVAQYARGDCPVADDLFDRMISISLNQWYTEADCGRIAEGINKVLSAYCTVDATAAPWR